MWSIRSPMKMSGRALVVSKPLMGTFALTLTQHFHKEIDVLRELTWVDGKSLR